MPAHRAGPPPQKKAPNPCQSANFSLYLQQTKEEMIMVTILIGAIIGLLFGLAFGNDKPEKKSWKPKKKNLFVRWGEHGTDYFW